VSDLGRYAATLRRLWLLALGVVALATATAYAVAHLSAVSYEASAKVLLDQDRKFAALLGTSAYSIDPERDLNTGVLLITLDPVAERVRRSLALGEPASALAARVTAESDRNSSIVSITATDPDARQAARIANAFAAAYQRFRAQAARQAIEDAVTVAEAQSAADAQARADLDAQVRRLRTVGAFEAAGVQLVQAAKASTATRHPRPALSAVVGGFLGLVLAALTIVILTRTDRRVRTERDIELAAGRPVVSVPALALSLRGPVVLVTSPGPDEGAADAALAIARALALTDRSAIVVEGEDDGGLGVGTARQEAEIVLLVGDPLPLATLADEAVLVACLDVSRGDELAAAIRDLGAAGLPPTAVVAVPRRMPVQRERPAPARPQEVPVA
jgi:capsular polysaccharide biosynthesis protein